MERKVKSRLFQAPAILLLIASFFASIYAKVVGMIGSWATPVVILLILVAYFYGRYLENKSEFF
jgi:hypothetical protein